MPVKRRPASPSPEDLAPLLKPIVKPLLKPVVEPVLQRLDRHEQLLTEMREALDIQFKRTAEVQAQLDRIASLLSEKSKK
jgi:hypothetical protein